MKRKGICAAAAALLLLTLCGCWSYRGLDEMTIVSGMALDYDARVKNYLLTCEVIDSAQMNEQQGGGTKSKLVEAQGKSVMDAARNAKKRLVNRLYWGDTQVLILGKSLLEDGSMNSVIDWFLRDAECRETVGVVVSDEESARKLLTIEGLDSTVVAREIKKILSDDQESTASLFNVPVYRIYNTMNTPGTELTLPKFHLAENDGREVVEADGEALFKGKKVAASFSSEESKYFLFAMDGVAGGVLLPYPNAEPGREITLEISESRTSRSYDDQNGKLTFKLKTVTKVYLDEQGEQVDVLDEGQMDKLEKQTEAFLENKIGLIIRKAQKEARSDIFGFGAMVYRRDPKLWKRLEPEWEKIFPTLDVKVESEVKLLNTSFVKGG